MDIERLRQFLDELDADPEGAADAALALLQERYGGVAYIMRMLRRAPAAVTPQALSILTRGRALDRKGVEIAAIAAAAALHCDFCLQAHLQAGLEAGLTPAEAFDAIIVAGQIANSSVQAHGFRTFQKVVKDA
jgi:AhpD family alkylhydroperoxidase